MACISGKAHLFSCVISFKRGFHIIVRCRLGRPSRFKLGLSDWDDHMETLPGRPRRLRRPGRSWSFGSLQILSGRPRRHKRFDENHPQTIRMTRTIQSYPRLQRLSHNSLLFLGYKMAAANHSARFMKTIGATESTGTIIWKLGFI